ncbi:precorrin-6A synthase (deacetylating) [Ancylobacter sp. 6x-1]|uniref:Precorrin-6A synthase [deacetylating] n=1 Tax=Ancylobacter crimeensis TaxID=2579147 RepID=A0ABT0DD47_9HYPH|nr:precorrin-6A synthase (deacetylating) [Ancylobacter crimeensis]MCK0197890.1 precorrin-6A synthase (deacetylating) [Ancylobacter crimeensis]
MTTHRRVLVIGIGMGEPSQLTFAAAEAIGRADLFLLLDKSEAAGALVAAREALIARFGKPGHRILRRESPRLERPAFPAPGEGVAGAGPYRDSVARWHGARARLMAEAIGELPPGGTAALLVWGDPMLYDSTLRVLAGARALARAPDFKVEVLPGISALQMLCAAHAIPLNGVGEPVLVTTGRRIAEATPDAPAFAVLLDDGAGLRALMARGWSGKVWWGAMLGTPDERLLAGRLSEVGDAILALRGELRARRGWVMDAWLGRNGEPG